MDDSRLRAKLRLLEIHAILSTLALVVLVAAAFRPRQMQRIPILEAERINIVEADGRLAMVIANGDRIPGPILEGRELPRSLSSGRQGSAGMLFFNARGDEVGGLTFGGRESDGGASAGSILAFDQFKQDQVVAVQYSHNGANRSAGVSVWDRSTTVPIHDVVSLLQAARGEAGSARDSAAARIEQLQREGALGAQRLFLGSQNRIAALRINDTSGRARIRLYVDSADVPRFEILDEGGRVVNEWPPAARQ